VFSGVTNGAFVDFSWIPTSAGMTVGVFVDISWILALAGVTTQISKEFSVEATWMNLRRLM
jgi:hypothetical protein